MPSHVVQSRRNVPHQAHQEERDLQNRIREEVQPSHQRVIPRHRVEIDEEGQCP